jgi:hypothetical protein
MEDQDVRSQPKSEITMENFNTDSGIDSSYTSDLESLTSRNYQFRMVKDRRYLVLNLILK